MGVVECVEGLLGEEKNWRENNEKVGRKKKEIKKN